VESNWVHSTLRPPIGLLCQPRVIMMMEKLVEWWLEGEIEVLGENLPQCPDANPGRRGGKPVTNRLSYGTAFLLVLSPAHKHKWLYMKLEYVSCSFSVSQTHDSTWSPNTTFLILIICSPSHEHAWLYMKPEYNVYNSSHCFFVSRTDRKRSIIYWKLS
jgi:hypothetical protein